MSYLILVRHGQSVWNLEKKFTGWVDVDLTENGKLEAKKSGQLIKKEQIEINHYFSSFQLRAKNTLKIIQDELKDFKKVDSAWELNERHYGSFTGLNKDEMIKKHGSKQVHIWRRSFDIPPPPMNSESPYHPSKNKNYANIGVFPIDTFYHFDTGFRVLNGEYPIKDFWVVSGIFVDYLEAFFFYLFGVSWKTHVFHSSFVNGIMATATYFVLRSFKLKKNFVT